MNPVNMVIGNGCSLLAMVTDAISSSQKTAKRVLWVQNLSQLIYCIGVIFLKGYSAAVQNIVSIIRNLIAIKKINSKALEWIMVALGVVLGLCFNNLGPVGLLPILANLQYTLAVFRFKDNERALKISFMCAALMFAVFSLSIYNIVGFFTNSVVAVTAAIFLLKRKNHDSESQ